MYQMTRSAVVWSLAAILWTIAAHAYPENVSLLNLTKLVWFVAILNVGVVATFYIHRKKAK